MKYEVYGTIKVHVTFTVDAENEESAIEKAMDECDGLTAYAGNGGMDKIVGTSDSRVSLAVEDEYAEFTSAEPA